MVICLGGGEGKESVYADGVPNGSVIIVVVVTGKGVEAV
jgi:hypothetical protein